MKEKKYKGDITKGQIDSRRNDYFYKRKGKVNAEREGWQPKRAE